MRILTNRINPIFFIPDVEAEPGEQEKVGGRESVHVSKEAREFGKRFKPPIDVAPPQKEDDKQGEQGGEKPEGGEQKGEQHREHKPPGSNVPKIIEDKRKAESERDEARVALGKYEKETVPALNKQIQELQAKVDSGKLSDAKEAEFQKKIDELEKTKADGDQKLREELEVTRKRLSVYDLANDPSYKEKYLRPLGESIETLRQIVGSNVQLSGALHRAMMAQKSSLQASSVEEKQAAEKERDEILENMLDGLGSVGQRRLNSAFDKYMEASEAQAYALADNERTSLEMRKDSERAMKDAVSQTMREWTTEFERQSPAYDDDLKIEGEVAEKVKELGITVDLEGETKFARGALEGKLQRADVVKLIHRGRAYAALNAKVKALEAINSGFKETIVKLRGSSPGGAGKSGEGGKVVDKGKNERGETVNREGKTREQWQHERFKPPTA